MIYQVLADTVVVLHLTFVLFAVLGGLLVPRRRRLAWIHVPAASWGVVIEWTGGECPLTPLENWLRGAAARPGYRGGFVEHYLVPVLYPAALSRDDQLVLGAAVLVINALVYGEAVRRWSRRA